MLKLINGDKWSWECDGPEAKDIKLMPADIAARCLLPLCFLTLCFIAHIAIGSRARGKRPRLEDANYNFSFGKRQLS